MADTDGPGPILYLAHRVPFPPDKGDRIRSFHVLSGLARRRPVDLAFLSDERVGEATRTALAGICRRVAAIPAPRRRRWARAAGSLAAGGSLTEGLFASPEMSRLLDGWLRDTPYHAAVCFSSGVLPHLLGRGLEGRLIVDLVDVDSQKFLDYAARAAGPKAALLRLEGRRVRDLERRAGASRRVVLATRAEAALYREICPEARVEAIPNGVDLEYFRPSPEPAEPGGCVFVGQLDYRANALGLEWFCGEAWPAVRERLPGATLRIVGRNPTAGVRRLGRRPGVEVVGEVPDVRPYLAEARVAVAPLPVARGVQNKVLEAMAAGRPVVASPAALEGLDLEPGREALVAPGPEDWARQLAGLWHDAPGRAGLGARARAYVERNHHWAASLGRFGDLIDLPEPSVAGLGAAACA